MKLSLSHINNKTLNGTINITGSKSESNRLLILQQIYPNLKVNNLGNAADVVILQTVLNNKIKIIDINHAGTAMRFLSAYLATINNEFILTGSKRMQQRPIKILVDALNELGANITYLKKNGFPPIKIKGNTNLSDYIAIDGNVSSQYISALLLIAPSLKNGLTIVLKGKITSKPYINMTRSLLDQIGVNSDWVGNKIKIYPKNKINDITINVESDWSSASYYFSLIALSESGTIKLTNFNENSLQGDKEIIKIYKYFGVISTIKNYNLILTKDEKFIAKKHISINLINTPDIAQTIVVTCFGLGISCDLTGLHTLKIKETDRLNALKIELKKLGAKVSITNNSLHLSINTAKQNIKNVTINTYQDHRMAMAFAPLSLLFPIKIKNADVVNKSYPNFWKDFESLFR